MFLLLLLLTARRPPLLRGGQCRMQKGSILDETGGKCIEWSWPVTPVQPERRLQPVREGVGLEWLAVAFQ